MRQVFLNTPPGVQKQGSIVVTPWCGLVRLLQALPFGQTRGSWEFLRFYKLCELLLAAAGAVFLTKTALPDLAAFVFCKNGRS